MRTYIKFIITLIFAFILLTLFNLNKVEATNYNISTKEELIKFAQEVNNGNSFEGQTVNLINDIDLEGSEDDQWTPIGQSYDVSFDGIFEGNGHIISGIYLHPTNYIQYMGLFGRSRGDINNLGVEGVFIIEDTGGSGVHLGGITGFNQDGVISKCFSNVEIINNRNSISIGGIVGTNSRGKFEYCYAKGTITNNSNDNDGSIMCIGGIIGVLMQEPVLYTLK